ncbi:hypothetical protein [Planotetraspora kaengkrachanensis]|uniref:Uncharacterized protein n=1 Tax=Planotetraspora kaengkrachanensis TaxID=575193 RepID=A0A8J3VBR6_9ACTN|nr:hypothetical protein [Planotetraspora kaengkrachanensis]GIG83834.1 hypothetical protein Pka01_69610 [Planotetraspora kaengkrachanensis]
MPDSPRVARLNVGLVLRELAEVTGVVLLEDGMCRGGQVGAVYVRWPDAHRSVLTWQAANAAADVRPAEELLATARAHGVPAPRYELVAELGRRVDEILAGAAAEEVVRACWAHMSLRMVDWSIRHLDAADVTGWVDAAEALRP